VSDATEVDLIFVPDPSVLKAFPFKAYAVEFTPYRS